MKAFKIIKIAFNGINMDFQDTSKLRGFFAEKNEKNAAFHNHTEIGFLYKYPEVQYKIIDNTPVIIAFGDALKPLYKCIMEMETINISGKEININNINIDMYEDKIGETKYSIHYTFLNPWLALNQKNYSKYKILKCEERNELLSKILIGNIISLSKHFGIMISGQLETNLNLKEIPVVFKNENMIGFTGNFSVNYNIPDYFGIGKGVSRGFGTVKLRS